MNFTNPDWFGMGSVYSWGHLDVLPSKKVTFLVEAVVAVPVPMKVSEVLGREFLSAKVVNDR